MCQTMRCTASNNRKWPAFCLQRKRWPERTFLHLTRPPMYEAEIRKALDSGPRCDFRYTGRGKPVLAFTLQSAGAAAAGVVKLNGRLIVLKPQSSAGATEGDGEFLLRTGPIQMAVTPDAEEQIIERRNVRRREANLIFQVGQSLQVGYRGYLDCTPQPPTLSPRETSGR